MASSASTQSLPCLVSSTNLGGGLFSYTFQRGNLPYIWGVRTNTDYYTDYIGLQSYGILGVQDAPGWTHTVSPSGLITWKVTNGIVFLDQPVTFTVQSCLTESTESTNYSGVNRGFIVGALYSLPDFTYFFEGGYQSFNFIGPALPRLGISQIGTSTTVSWSAEAQGLQLEASDRLDTLASWESITNIPTIVGSKYNVGISATSRQKFFRLVIPCSQ